MDNLSISAASGMRARLESLDMLANNLANIETGGFKADREFYSVYSGLDSSADSLTGDMATLPVIEAQWTDQAQGGLRDTANPLDFAIDGEGWFGIQTPNGIRYTRNGSFRVSPAGLLTTREGNPVRAVGGGTLALQSGVPVEVSADGNVSQGGQPAGQFELSTFAPGGLTKTGANSFSPVPDASPRAAKPVIHQGKLEQSNVGTAESAVRLVSILRQFEMLQKAMNIGNELNRRAIEEVARVTP